MIKLKPLWSKMLYTSLAGVILLFILSFNFKGEDNLMFKKNLISLHKINDIDSAILDYTKKDIYYDEDIFILSKINSYQVNELITKNEAEKCKNDLRNKRFTFIIESCTNQLYEGDYNNLDERPFLLLKKSDILSTSFADDAIRINRNRKAINYYLEQLPNELMEYMLLCKMNCYYYSVYKTDLFRNKVKAIPNLDSYYTDNSAIQEAKSIMITAIDQFEAYMVMNC